VRGLCSYSERTDLALLGTRYAGWHFLLLLLLPLLLLLRQSCFSRWCCWSS
jgi:hypothetical protein